MKNKSISMRLKKVSTYEAQNETLKEWRESWRKDQLLTIIKLRRAAEVDDHSEIMHMIDQLMGLTDKRFTGLESVLSMLSDPNRQLKHREASVPEEVNEVSEDVKAPAAPEMEKPIVPLPEDIERGTNSDNMAAEIVKCYNSQMPVKEIADWHKINAHKVIKILVTAGVYTSETYEMVKVLRERGLSDKEIASRLGLSKSTINDYTPYKKGIYNSESPSKNAENIRRYRQNKNEN